MKRALARFRRFLFWFSLLLALAVLMFGFRYRVIEGASCVSNVEQIVDASTKVRVPLPIRVVAATDAAPFSTLRYRFDFEPLKVDHGSLAIMIGEALPFYRLRVNGADLTPEIDLGARNLRDMAPHLHILPRDVIRPGVNTAELEMPLAASLAELRVDQICVGSLAVLEPSFRANWWRMVGVAAICALLICTLMVLGAALWLLSGRHPAHAWYVGCLVLLLARTVYVSSTYRPGSPLLWVFLGNVAVALLPYALYRFMRAYWQFALPWLSRALVVITIFALADCVQLYVVPRAEFAQANYVLLLMVTTIGEILVVLAMATRFRSLDRAERAVVIWVGCFAFFGLLFEVANLFLPFEQRWMWTKPPVVTVLAIGLGYLLLRRMALGADLLAHAADSLALDLDQAISMDAEADAPVWKSVSSSISRRERGRMIRDIHDGFGSRLVAVLMRARRELPNSMLHRQIQRALLDMRLMLDAMDETSRSLGMVMARLRHRIEPLLTTVGIASEWQFDQVAEVRIDDRRKLILVLRCLEELLCNSVQHSGADQLRVNITIRYGQLSFEISDNGCGMDPVESAKGRGIAQIHLRAQMLGGTLAIGAGDDGRGLHCVLQVPLF